MSNSYQQEEIPKFPVQVLNQALNQTKKVKVKMGPLIAQFQNHNIYWMYQTLNYIKLYLTKPKVDINFKFNAIYAIKVLFDTSDFLIVNWIQTYFLSDFMKIIMAGINQPDKDRGKDYFIKMGYSLKQQANAQKFGYNYNILASQLLQVAALVKPYKLYENQFTKQPSDFVRALEHLKKNGFKPSEKLVIYSKPQSLKAQIEQYHKNMNELTQDYIERYEEFSQRKFKQYLNIQHPTQEQKYGLSILSIYESGDLYVTSAAIQICKQSLTEPKQAITMKNSLYVLHRLMLSAEYETYFVLNNQDLLNNFLTQIVTSKSQNTSLERGSQVFVNLKNPKGMRQVYCIFLDYLQKWSNYSLSTNQNDVNIIKYAYALLKNKLKLQFPEATNLQHEQKIFEQNKLKNKIRNERLANQIESKSCQLKQHIKRLQIFLDQTNQKEGTNKSKLKTQVRQPQISSLSQNSKVSEPKVSKTKIQQVESLSKPITQNKANPNQTPQGPPSSRKGIHPLKQNMLNCQQILRVLMKDEANYEKNRKVLKQFVNNLDSELQKVPQDVFNDIYQDALKLNDDIIEILNKPPPSKSKSKIESPNKNNANNNTIVQKKVESVTVLAEQKIQNQQYSKANTNQLEKVNTSKQNIKIDIKQGVQIKDANLDTPVKKINFDDNQHRPLGSHLNEHLQSKSKQERQNFSDMSSQLKQSSLVNQVNQKQQTKPYNPYSHLGYAQELNQKPMQESATKKMSIKRTQDINNTNKSNVSRKDLDESNQKGYRKLQNLPSDPSKQIQKLDFSRKDNLNSFQHVQPLQQELQNYSIKKPKTFKSLGGNRKTESLSNNRIPSKQILPFQKPTFENQNFQRSSVSNYSPQNLKMKRDQVYENYISEHQQQYQQLLHDQIDLPQSSPMQQSFHDISEIQQKVKNHKVPSFKKCFEADKYVLPQDKKTKMFWLETETANLLKTNNRKQRLNGSRASSKISVPEILEQRNKKYQHQIKGVEEQKNRKIKELQNKIKHLEGEGKSMKDQLQYQREEIKTLRANSQTDRESQGQKGYLQDMQNMAAHHKFNTPAKLGGFSAPRMNFDTTHFKESLLLDPTGKLINSKIYKGFFEQFRKQKQKKGLLKNKQLLHKDKNLQIGCMGKKQNDRLIITFYITPERDLQSVTWDLKQSQSLHIDSQPKQFLDIKAKKQQKLYLTVQIRRIPYLLPIIEFFYKSQEYTQSVKVTVPCAFHKFVYVKQTQDSRLQKVFSVKQSIIRGQQVPYSKKILKNLEIFRQYFTNMNLLNKGQLNSQGQISYGGIAHFKNLQFPVRISVKQNQFLYVQASTANKKQDDVSTIEFYISLLSHLLMKEIQ